MKANSAKLSARSVIIVVYDNVKLLDVTGPVQVFSDARQRDGSKAYDISIVSIDGGSVSTDTIIPLDTIRADKVSAGDTFIVAGGRGALEARYSSTLQKMVGQASRSARRICSICLGAFILAEAGVLNGKHATTHWMESVRLSQDYSYVSVTEDAIFVKDGSVWTSAGVTAGIDMALALVEEDLGRKEALRVARLLVLPMKRLGGQTQFSSILRYQTESLTGRFDALLAAIETHPAEDYSVPRMAAMTNMSERNFARLFKAETGCSPSLYVEQVRLEAVREALISGNVKMKVAALDFGFGSEENMRRAFKRRFGATPSDIVDQFTSTQS